MTRDELIALVEDMRYDWAKMNEFVNATATMMGWCDEYEERLYQHNEAFKVLRAQGRVPEGKPITVRNVLAARRLAMSHVINTLNHHGIELPKGALCGVVVRDHKAFTAAHKQLTAKLERPEE